MLKRWLGLFVKIFVVGMIIHFFVHTLVTYGLGFSPVWMDIVWLWKELLIVAVSGIVGFLVVSNKLYRQQLFNDRFWLGFMVVLFVLIVWSGIVSFGIYNQGLYDWILAFKYDFFPLVVFGVVYALFRFFPIDSDNSIVWFVRLLQGLLLVSLVWYLFSHRVPELLVNLGYSLEAYQRVYGEEPPLHYLTNIWTGNIRNQGLFGGPVSRGFFLIAFWPLFLVQLLKQYHAQVRQGQNKKIVQGQQDKAMIRKICFCVDWNKMRLRGCSFFRIVWLGFRLVLYTVNVYVTYSRAAWLVFVIQSFVLIVWYFRRWRKQLLLGGVVCGVLAVVGLLGWQGSDMFSRDLSDDGHVTHVLEGIAKFVSSPVLGLGAGTAGPASYRLGDDGFFNPENQYLQIAIEFGIVGLVLWLALYGMIVWKALYRKTQFMSALLSVGGTLILGLVGLGIAGMFLHPAVDSQVMYVMVVMLAIIVAR